MKIKSNAATGELSSPFYKVNRDFCKAFEEFIAHKNGEVKGTYNAWSYLVEGRISHPKPWRLRYKKATYTSTGNLILSAKKQSLLTLAEWSAPWAAPSNSIFSIVRKRDIGFLEKFFSPNFNGYPFSKKYVVTDANSNEALIKNLYIKLEPLFLSEELKSITLKNDILLISLDTDKHHFNIFENLFDL